MNLLVVFLYIVFVLAAIVLITVVLIQEGKGGGLGGAFGAAGQQTFGVGASGINKFTAVTAGVFLGTALTIHVLNRIGSESSVVDGAGQAIEAPLDLGAGAAGGAPAGGAAPAGGPDGN